MKFTINKTPRNNPMSNNSSSSASSGGVGFLGLLAILFIGLKLGNVIDWSWVWVLAPLWAVPAFIIVVGCLFIMAGGIILGIDKIIKIINRK